MRCEEVEVLLAEYVVGALPGEQARAVGEHLRQCDGHPDASELALGALALGYASEPLEPPPQLRARLFEAVGGAEPRQRRRRRWLSLLAPAAALVAALAVAAWALFPSGSEDEKVLAQATAPDGGTLALVEDGAALVVEVRGLPRPPGGLAYQLWAIRGEEWVPLHTLGTGVTSWRGAVQYPFRRGDQLCLTLEAPEGAAWPTSAPVLIASVVADP